MFYGFKDGKCYRLRKRITSAICTMCILFNLFPMSVFNAYGAEGGVNATTTENSISADGELQLMDGWTLKKIENNVTANGEKSYAIDGEDKNFHDEIKGNYTNGYTSEASALIIDTNKKLAAFARFVNEGNDFVGKYVKLTADINLDQESGGITYTLNEDSANKTVTVIVNGTVSHKWYPIGNSTSNAFNGTFIGDNHDITNMFGDSGLFGYVSTGGVVKGVNVKRSIVSNSTSGLYAGGIVGTNKGEISNCNNSGSVSSSSRSGGIAGNNNGTINNCNNSGLVSYTSSGSSVAGGIAGYNDGTIRNCNNSGYVFDNSCAGGIAGYNEGKISNCSNSGSVSSTDDFAYAGGIAGNNASTIENVGIIEGCMNSGSVSSTADTSDVLAYSGGIAGYNYGTIRNCNNSGSASSCCSGGIAGYNNSTINNCNNSGSVSATANSSTTSYAGGIAGYNKWTISNCNNSGSVSASGNSDTCAGGIVGENPSEPVQYCLSTSKKIESTSSFCGGIAGKLSGAIQECYYDNSIVSGVTGAMQGSDDADNNVQGKSTSELQNGENLFNKINQDDTINWLYKNGYYPVLNCLNFAITPSITIDDKGQATGSFTITNEYKGYYNEDSVIYGWYRNDDTASPISSKKSYELQPGDEKDTIRFVVLSKNDQSNFGNCAEAVANITKKVPSFSISDMTTSLAKPTAKTIKGNVNNPDSLVLKYEYKSNTGTDYKDLPGDDTVINPGSYTLRVTYVSSINYYGKVLEKGFSVDKNSTPSADKFTFTAPTNLGYDGNAKTATVTANNNIIDNKNITIKYYKDGTTLVDKAIDAGEYTVKIDVKATDNYKGGSNITGAGWTFTIGKVKVENIETPAAKSDIKYGTKLSDINLEAGWNWVNGDTVPSAETAGYEAYFDMKYDPNKDYSAVEGYNKDNNRVERLVSVTTFVDKTNWGKPAEPKYDNVENYVSDDGAVSAEVKENGIVWINSESADKPVWYAIDNSNGIFEKGSRFEIKRLDKELSQDDWEKYKGLFDDKHLKELNEDKLDIFLVTVTSPDGKEYKQLNSDLSLYVKLGDDWDKDDLAAVFLGEGNNEDIGLEYIDSMSCPGGTDRFAKLTLKHFSPYAIYEKAANNNPSNGKPSTVSNANTNSGAQSNVDNSNVNSTGKQTNDAKKDESAWDYVATGDQTSYSFILGTTIIAIISYSAIVLLRRKRKEK